MEQKEEEEVEEKEKKTGGTLIESRQIPKSR